MREKDSLKNISDEIKEYRQIKSEYVKAEAEYNKIKVTANKASVDYELKNNMYLDEQAGILAQTLEAGVGCPVCGSVEHPKPAVLTANAPTKTELEKAKKLSETQSNKLTKQSEIAGKYKTQRDEKIKSIEKNAREILGDCESNDIFAGLKVKMQEVLATEDKLKSDIEKKEKEKKQYEDLEEQIPAKEKQIAKKEEEKQGFDREITSLNTQIKEKTQAHDKLKRTLKFSSKREAQKDINAKKQQMDELKKSYDAAEKLYNKSNDEKTVLEGEMKAYEAQLAQAPEFNMDELKSENNRFEQEKKRLEVERDVIKDRVSGNKKAISGISKQSKQLSVAEEKYAWVKSLSNTMNGSITGKEKIMLETYVQMMYFDRIIIRANTRFMQMSGGQYELVRRIEGGGRSQSGLELDVVDHHNGSTRSVKTLSGGESFKAALSLALGLSDEICDSAGGIRLDTMFVDEGFGSLDDESLKSAINTLAGLTEGNRLIGIISHVGELKQKIDMQIVIEKDKYAGSRARIVV